MFINTMVVSTGDFQELKPYLSEEDYNEFLSIGYKENQYITLFIEETEDIAYINQIGGDSFEVTQDFRKYIQENRY